MGSISSVRELRAALWRQAWLVLLLAAAGIAAAVAFAASRPTVYEATAVVQIEPPDLAGPGGAAGGLGGMAGGLTANAQLDRIELRLRSRDTMAALAERLGLFPEAGSETERVGALRDAIAIRKLVDPAQAWRPEVQPGGLAISARLDDAEDAAALANALAVAVVDEARGRARAVAEQTLAFHRSEEARVRAALAEVEEEIATVRAANIASLPEAVASQRERLTLLSADRIAAEQALLEFESGSLRLRTDDADRQRALLEEARDAVLAALAETQGALDAAPAVERQLGGLGRELATLEAELAVVIADRRDAETVLRLDEAEMASRFAVLETALPPEFPVSRDPRKLALAGSVAAVIGALAVALAREITQPAIRTAAQMSRALGIEPVVVIPRLRRRRGRAGWGLLLALGAAAAAAAWALGRGGLGRLLDLLPRSAPSAGG